MARITLLPEDKSVQPNRKTRKQIAFEHVVDQRH
jgi:hypothetical protein